MGCCKREGLFDLNRYLLFVTFFSFTSLALAQSSSGFEKVVLPGVGQQQTELSIQDQGRYRIRVQSDSGTALQVVDAMAGVLGNSGKPGQRDGQLDLLLEKGTYLIRTEGFDQAQGDAKLSLEAFVEKNTSPKRLLPIDIETDQLGDLEQKTYEIVHPEPGILRLEILGRHLQDARIWYADGWVAPAIPTRSLYEPETGKPMVHLEFHHALPSGRYFLVCYGGPGENWSVGDPSRPLHLRMDTRQWGSEGIHDITVSPFGRESFLVEGSANYIEVHRTKPAQTVLTRTDVNKPDAPRFQGPNRSVRMTDKFKIPLISLATNYTQKRRWITVEAAPGDRVTLRYFQRSYGTYLNQKTEHQYLATLHGAKVLDTMGTTALLRVTHPNQEPVFEKSQLLNITPDSSWWRQVDLQGNQVAWLRVGQAGSFTFTEQPGVSASAQYQLTPYPKNNRRRGSSNTYRNPGAVFDLAAGIYKLTVRPVRRGLLSFGMSASGQKPNFDKQVPPFVVPEIAWGAVTLAKSSQSRHEFLLASQQNIPYALIQRDWPLNLKNPLPLILMPGESRSVKLKLSKPRQISLEKPLRVRFESNEPLPQGNLVPAGNHHLIVTNPGKLLASGNLAAWSPQSNQAPISQREALQPNQMTYFDLGANQGKDFQITLTRAGMYRIETSGQLETLLTLHGRTLSGLAKGQQNGIGRNGLIQVYLKAGEYVLQVKTLGKTKGRLGLKFAQTALLDGGRLTLGELAKAQIPANGAIRYGLPIFEKDTYRITTLGLGKDFPLRLEDKDGWPVFPVNQRGNAELALSPGDYVYYSLPATIGSRRLTKVEKVNSPSIFDGKGPHQLVWNQPVRAIWQEGDPDLYQFRVSASAEVKIEMTPGMVGTLNTGFEPIFGGEIWKRELAPGDYQLRVKRPEADNQFPYQLTLSTKDLIPGLSQAIRSYPATIAVNLAQPGIVDLNFEGPTDVRAELLYSTEGPSLARADDSIHDWNPRFSQRLLAGSYVLHVDAVGDHFGPGSVSMALRPEKKIASKRFPFKINQAAGGQVLRMPFKLSKDRVVQFQREKGSPIALSLVEGTRILARGRESLTVPLRKDKAYEIHAWAENGSGSFTLSATARTAKKVTLGAETSQLKTGKNLYLVADPPQTFQTGLAQQLLFGDRWEEPLQPLSSSLLNLAGGTGWLQGNAGKLKLSPLRMSAQEPKDFVLRDASIAFQLEANGPGLLHLKSVDDFWRMRIGNSETQTNPWQHMVRTKDGLILAIGNAGQFPIHLWRQENTRVASVVSLAFLPFETSTNAGQLEPGTSQKFPLAETMTGLLLSKEMTAVWWQEGQPKGIWHSQDIAEQFNANASKGELILFNQAASPGHFRILTQKSPIAQEAWITSAEAQFERLWQTPGRFNLNLAEVTGSVLHVEGKGVDIRFFGEDGSYWEGTPPISLPARPGYFQFDHDRGWLSMWFSEPNTRDQAWLGDAKQETQLADQPMPLDGNASSHRFRIDSPQFRQFQINQPGVLGLMRNGTLLASKTSGGFAPATLRRYLQPGTYELAVRPFHFTSSPILLKHSKIPIKKTQAVTQAFLADNQTHVYQFQLETEAKVGLGLKTERGNLQAELVADDGSSLASGAIIIKSLEPGTYLLTVHNNGKPALYQPLFYGLDGSKVQIPENVIRKYLNTGP